MSHPAEQQAIQTYRNIFESRPAWLASAPGRVNLIGEFTDFNGGFVLPMAIEQRTAIAAAPNDSHEVVLHSEARDETARIDISQPLLPGCKGRWSNYPLGVLAGFAELGCVPRGFNAVISSTVPIGGGLSSSAALETATASLIQGMWKHTLDAVSTALLCQRAEHRYAQVPCGIMDQFICLMGRAGYALLLDCRSTAPSWVPWADPQVAVLVVDTGVKHELAGSEYAARRDACESAAKTMGVSLLRDAGLDLLQAHALEMDEMTRGCARHVIAENLRTQQAAACIVEREWASLGGLMYESHESLRSDYRVSCRELDLVVELARGMGVGEGVFGARMTGGGFGGCALVLIETARQQHIMRELSDGYRRGSGLKPALFVTPACGGARSLEILP